MEITEEQRKRAEANRLAALSKRKAAAGHSTTVTAAAASTHHDEEQHPWRLFKCRKIVNELPSANNYSFRKPVPELQRLGQESVRTDDRHHEGEQVKLAEKFRARLEICSPDSFQIAPIAVEGFVYPGEAECLRRLGDSLSNVIQSHYTQNQAGGKACVYKLWDYDVVLKSLRSSKGIEVEEIPWSTFNVVERLSHSFVAGKWIPCRPEHFADEKVNELIEQLPKSLLGSLLPFQLDGVRYGLQRGARCLIADEMGLGKTLQAIAIACCFMNEGSILVVCPAILRYSWAEEFERWLPCLPSDIHLVAFSSERRIQIPSHHLATTLPSELDHSLFSLSVFGHLDNPSHLSKCPKIVVISYTMLHRLRKTMLERDWAVLIVDESHHVRGTKKTSETEEVNAVLNVATKIKRVVLLSGTPSLSRPFDIYHQINMLWPGLLGKHKYDFAKTYCAVTLRHDSQGKLFQDYSKGSRLEELNILLKQTVMIRRLKDHVLFELPPKRRQIIRLLLKKSDIASAIAATCAENDATSERDIPDVKEPDALDESNDGVCCRKSSINLSYQQLGIAKLSGFFEWLSIHPIVTVSEGAGDANSRSFKMIVFGHHHKVLNGIQEFLCDKGIGFVRIDGTTPAKDRQSAVLSFQSSTKVKVALIGIEAGGVGVDLSVAHNVVFLELPKSPNLMLQAEDRAHRRGQNNAVNIYIFCAKDTLDESRWHNLNKKLQRVSSTTNGKYDAVHEIAVEDVSYLKWLNKSKVIGNDVHQNQDVDQSVGTENFNSIAIGSIQAMQPVKAYNEIAETLVDEITTQTESGDDLILKAHRTKGDEKADIVLEVNSSDSERKPEVSASISFCELEARHKEVGEHLTEIKSEFLLINKANEESALRFEVSRYTRRIHLYSCVPGEDLRPRPLYVNLRPEEIELLDSPDADKNLSLKLIKENTAYRLAIVAFMNEWNELRPIQRSKLLGKPLQLPLAAEIYYLNESTNHNSGGLLKGGSKRRNTPCVDISHPLPSNATWKKVHLCSGYGRKEKEYTQGRTLTGEPLCKLCQTPCTNNNAKTPEYFEDLFCKLGCYEEYRLRTSNTFLRRELFQLENGVCTQCQLDCHKLVKHLKHLSLAKRVKYIEKNAPKVARRKKLLDKLVNDPVPGNAWHADHIVAVYQGGGECKLENMRTLCVACHYDVTAAQRTERRTARAEAKKQLKMILKDLNKGQKTGSSKSDSKGHPPLEEQEDTMEDELFVKVPGSAYSTDTVPDTTGRKNDDSEEPSENNPTTNSLGNTIDS